MIHLFILHIDLNIPQESSVVMTVGFFMVGINTDFDLLYLNTLIFDKSVVMFVVPM